MQSNYYSPSINIQRDRENTLNYIPTRNGERAFQKITSSFSHGTKAFNIIGAYGSGKSAFILALEKVISNKAEYFHNPYKDTIASFESTFFIGEYTSFKEVFCETFGIKKSSNIIKELKALFETDAANKVGHLIVVDEFGKFLEYAAKESPEDELYFIQQISELANSDRLPILFITTLHQAFEDYAFSLTKTQKKEWDKVKGRLMEISFNEPVEQLLFLASERITQSSFPCYIDVADQKILFDIIQGAGAFPLRDYFSFEFCQKLFPFDILSASIATVSFQRYGQNERSLFTFLASEDYLGLNDFTNGKEYYNIAHIYDYLKYNFHSLLNSRFNPDSVQWKALDDSLQRAESIFDTNYNDAIKILKTIGLLSIMGRQGQKITKEFLITYSRLALDIKDSESIIDKLELKQIIRYRNYSQRYVLFRGTDFDINFELEIADGQVSKEFSVAHQLQKHFNFPVLGAKRVFFDKGTPRYFVFIISENPIEKVPEGHIDGYINLIFNKLLEPEAIQKYSASNKDAILFGLLQNVNDIKRVLIEIEKIQLVKSKCIDDQIASAELEAQLVSYRNDLNEMVLNSFYGDGSEICWYFQGYKKSLRNAKELNLLISEICEVIYFTTPKFRNELINREKVSGTISLAKNRLIEQLISSIDDENLGFEQDRFPPEKTIYLSLLKKTGIHTVLDNKGQLGSPSETSFISLWSVSESFLNDCAISSRKLSDFIEILRSKPFKLKQGFIDFWVPVFLIAKQKYFAFYEQETFIPELTSDTIEIAIRQPQKYRISTFNLSENRLKIFNRYRYFLDLIEENVPNSDSFIETIKPFLSFYRRLVFFTKQTKQLSKESSRLREAISNATDPEKIFFEDIPAALGFTLNDFFDDSKLEYFSVILQDATRELSSAFSNLVNRIEETINQTIRDDKISFPENKLLLQQRFKKLKKEQIDPKLRVLVQRINTPLDDRQSWISSIATAIMSKSLEQFTDDDELAFKHIFPRRIYELDNLTEISKKDIDVEKEEVLKLEVTSFVKGVQQNLIRLPKNKSNQLDVKRETIKKLLFKNDKQLNIAILIKLLQEEIENE